MVEASTFVVEMGKRLESTAPNIVAVPKTDQSIFRIYRDTRFSKDKRPYKTHLAVFLWEGPFKKMENSGFYFHLEPDKVFLGVGLYRFPSHLLKSYRDAVVHKQYGKSLTQAIEKVTKNKKYVFGWKQYKKVPRGYDPDHENAELLLHGGLIYSAQRRLIIVIKNSKTCRPFISGYVRCCIERPSKGTSCRAT
jgi:uncharacterized protein (TIGR02453 family)